MVYYVNDDQLGGLDQSYLPLGNTGTQDTPVVTRLSGGGFVAAWHSGTTVVSQVYDASGTRAGPQYVTTYDGSQPALTGLAGGGFALAWSNSTGVQFRFYDGVGLPTTQSFQADAADTRGQQPSIVTLANGNLVVAWNSTGSDTQLKGARIRWSGNPLTGDIAVATGRSTSTNHPVVAALKNGNFVVSWSGEFVSGQNDTVYAQIYGPGGQAVGTSLHIDAPIAGAGNNYFQSIAALASGGFALSWTHAEGQATSNADTSTAVGQSFVNAIEGGGFAVSWQQATNNGGPNYFQIGDIRAQVFNGDATKVGAEFTVNQVTAYGQGSPAATSFGTGDVAWVWQTFAAGGEADVAVRPFFSVTNGTAGDDTLTGTPGVDILRGLDGADTLSAGWATTSWRAAPAMTY